MTTIGQLIEALYSKYERQYQDHDLAAIATQRELERILRTRRGGRIAHTALPAVSG